MLLTAMYSEEEADVTAMRVLESASSLPSRTPSDETIQKGIKGFFALRKYLATRKGVRERKKALRECTCP